MGKENHSVAATEYIPVLVSFISGGLAGAVVNAFVTRRWQKTQVALSIIERFFSSYDDIARAKSILRDPTSTKAVDNQNTVRKVGDWFELVSSLWKHSSLNRDLIKEVAIPKEIDLFRDLVTNSKSFTDVFLEAKSWWPDLYQIKF
jgi:hypothetical protein